ncbi:MAG TPA: hypothetical protein VNQ90_01195 [Chthoniobacteraceae bacterium]|nr:hypothetical protein [Chthoniobacteraceae bacterium]
MFPLSSSRKQWIGRACATALLFHGTLAYSAVLATYGFIDNSMSPDAVEPFLSAGSVSAGAGLTLFESTTTNTRGFPAALFQGGDDGVLQLRSGGTPSEDAAVTANSYIEIVLEVDPGHRLDLSQLTFNAASTGASQPRIFAVQANAGSGFVPVGSSAGLTESVVTNTTLDLSLFTGVTAPISFRFYVVDGATSGTRTLGIDDITFEGTVEAIPEPAATALFLLCGVGLLLRKVAPRLHD